MIFPVYALPSQISAGGGGRQPMVVVKSKERKENIADSE